MAQMVECLPSKCEAQCLHPSTAERETERELFTVKPFRLLIILIFFIL
jgi:hypothetical protein